jgi:HAD superfamily hydrolase (TIGR01509 family)
MHSAPPSPQTVICRLTGFSGTLEEFGEFFADIFTPIPEMVELHAALKRKGYPTWIFSNTNFLAVSHIGKRFPFYGGFDGYILSCEHGAMKPDPKLYEVVERATKANGAQIVYIDDRPENIQTGAARGWNAVLHETPEKTRAALVKSGVPYCSMNRSLTIIMVSAAITSEQLLPNRFKVAEASA